MVSQQARTLRLSRHLRSIRSMGVIIKMETPNSLESRNLFIKSPGATRIARNVGIMAVATILPGGYVVLGASYVLRRYVCRNVESGVTNESPLETI